MAPLSATVAHASETHDVLPVVLRALATLDVTVLLSTVGRPEPPPMPNLFSAPFLPAHQALARAALVISKGGSTTGYQALAGGVSVVGIASNLDPRAVVVSGAIFDRRHRNAGLGECWDQGQVALSATSTTGNE